MFEKTVIRRAEEADSLTLGQIAEAMVFYGRVHVVLDQRSVADIVKKGRYNDLLMLLGHENVSAVYVEDMLATHTEKMGNREVHAFASIMMAGRDGHQNLGNRKSRLIDTFERLGFDRKTAVTKAERLKSVVSIKRFTDFAERPREITHAATEDLFDSAFVKSAITEILRQQGDPSFGADFKFEAMQISDAHFEIKTDLIPSKGMTIAGLLVKMLEARADLTIAAFYGGDFETSSAVSSLIRLRTKEILRRTDLDRSQIDSFKELVLPQSPSIAEIVDSEQRSMPEFMRLVKQAGRFHDWINRAPPDASLAQEYLAAIAKESWISSFPARGLRFMLGLGVGAASPLGGAVTSLADTFLLERMLGGWRPSHFVDRKLRTFSGSL